MEERKLKLSRSTTISVSVGAGPFNSGKNSSAVSTQRRTVESLCFLLLLLPVADAMSTVMRSRSASVAPVLQPTLHGSESPNKREDRISWTDELLGNFNDNDDLPDGFQDDLYDVQELQTSIGSEIVERVLQQQIDSAGKSPNVFLDHYMQDASMLEKVAMASLPQQLPKPAVKALSRKVKAKKDQHSLNFSSRRITPGQELLLAQKIQQGVALHKVKTDYESKYGREISKKEWMDLANLDSPKDLRRLVSEYRQSKQLLVAANMGLVHAVVKSQFSAKRGPTSFEELVQEGSLGLMRAAELFDPSRGLRFSTYATIWIKGMLSNSNVKETITLPMREKAKWNKMRSAHRDLSRELGREPTKEEVALRCDMSVEEILVVSRKMTQAKSLLSLDYEYKSQSRSGDDIGEGGSLQNDKHLMEDADLVERTQLQADVVATLARNLDAREARLMRLRYGLVDGQTRSIQECADCMGLSKTRVQQLASSCLKKLREASEAEALQEYLLTVA